MVQMFKKQIFNLLFSGTHYQPASYEEDISYQSHKMGAPSPLAPPESSSGGGGAVRPLRAGSVSGLAECLLPLRAQLGLAPLEPEWTWTETVGLVHRLHSQAQARSGDGGPASCGIGAGFSRLPWKQCGSLPPPAERTWVPPASRGSSTAPGGTLRFPPAPARNIAQWATSSLL